MTNEEKASAIGILVRDLCVSNGVTRDNAETASLLVQKYSLKMAEWKDQQFKELLCKWMNEGKIDAALDYLIENKKEEK